MVLAPVVEKTLSHRPNASPLFFFNASPQLGAFVSRPCVCADGQAHYAARAGHRDVLELMLKAGGSLDVNNRDGKTAKFYAMQYPALKKLVE